VRRVDLITDIAFWQSGRGDAARVRALVEYVRLTRVLDLLPPGTRAFLDTHDIASERNARFAVAGLTPCFADLLAAIEGPAT
jgi:hypothetical protein